MPTMRAVFNAVNGSTALGLLLARAGGAHLVRPPEQAPPDLLIAVGFSGRWLAPHARAITVGNVVLGRFTEAELPGLAELLWHEGEHTTQWAWGLGPLGFLPGYWLASAWSWVRQGDPARGNIFEQAAGLRAGGYLTDAGRGRPLR